MGVSWGPSPPSTGTHDPRLAHTSWKVPPCAALVPGSRGVGILLYRGLCLRERQGRGTFSWSSSEGQSVVRQSAPQQVYPQPHAKIFHSALATHTVGWAPRSPFTEETVEEGLGCQKVPGSSRFDQPVICKRAHGRAFGVWLSFFVFLLGETAPCSLPPAHLSQLLKNSPGCLLGWHGRGFCLSPHPGLQGTKVSCPRHT